MSRAVISSSFAVGIVVVLLRDREGEGERERERGGERERGRERGREGDSTYINHFTEMREGIVFELYSNVFSNK